MKAAILTTLTILVTQTISLCQTDTLKVIKGFVFDIDTEHSIPNAEITINGTDGSSVEFHSDSNGIFTYSIKKNHSYVLTAGNPRRGYMNQTKKVIAETPSDSLITFGLYYAPKIDWFPEFSFANNSIEPSDTSGFWAWDIISLFQDTIDRIVVTGYGSPNEPENIGRKRANEIINGYVLRGGNRESYVARNGVSKYPEIRNSFYLQVEGKKVRFDNRMNLNDSIIAKVLPENEDLIYNFMRRVQISRESK